MEDRRIDELQEKLQGLIHQQHKISNEIRELQIAVDSLKQPSKKENPVLEQVPTSKPVLETSAAEKKLYAVPSSYVRAHCRHALT